MLPVDPSDSRFAFCVPIILKWEGGLHTDPNDPGGTTNFGISQRAYPNLNISTLTVTDAEQIYYNDYWLASGCKLMPSGNLDLFLFNFSVTSGVAEAIRCLQRMLGVNADGNFGPITKAALVRYPAAQQTNYMTQCVRSYEQDADYALYANGWLNRLFAIAATKS